MMRVRILSDLHLDVNRGAAPDAIFADRNFDVLAVAGDVRQDPVEAIRWLESQKAWADKSIVYVLGNHEFYDEDFDAARKAAARAARMTCGRIHCLDPGVAIIDGVRFIGATLWSDLKAIVTAQPFMVAEQGLNDYRVIRRDGGRLRAIETAQEHDRQLAFIVEATKTPFDGATVVVTHHAPSMRSVTPIYKDDPVTICFASVLDDQMQRMVERGVKLWIHGHVHNNARYRCGVEVVCNPVGYGVFSGKRENSGFDPKLTIEI